jgi:CheY-like chemotaxis protein
MPEHRRPKVIVMTAIYRSELYRLEATIKYQADGYLRKPFKIEDLTQCIQSLLLDETQ